MPIQFLPTCCYYPTTLLLVDDNPDLLSDLSLALTSHYKSKYSTSPKQIVDWIKQQGGMEELVKQWVSMPEEYLPETVVKINVPALHQQLYAKPPRFSRQIILIVDYAMPEMNGIELAKLIRRELSSPVKIIMLTGEADQLTAVRAFNDKLIDRFILKSSSDYIEKLVEYVQELQTEYFKELSNLVLGSSISEQSTVRHDPRFIKLFNDVAQKHHAVEYYLLEEPGSYLFLDEKKNSVRLILKTEEDMQMLYELARDERNISGDIIEALEKRKKLVYFPDEKSKLAPAKQWNLQDAEVLQTRENYYYSVVKGNKDDPLDIEKIISYEQFLNS